MKSLSWILAVLPFGAGCAAQPVRSGRLIEQYSRGTCVPGRVEPNIYPSTRGWDVVIMTAGKSRVRIIGADTVGGRIDVEFEGGKRMVAAGSGDYVYPKDVRLAPDHRVLFIKTSGVVPWFGNPQKTFLYEFDLQARRQTEDVLVDPKYLPPECPDPRGSAKSGGAR
jgi:hypothetical protein